MKTMAIRVDTDVHARLSLLAKLNKRSLTDELIEAITSHLDKHWTDEALQAQASEALAEIDREAATRRQAIESLLKPGAGEGKGASKRKR